MPITEELEAAMRAIEAQESAPMSADIRQAALAGLGSKYLAVGAPASLGILDAGSAAKMLCTCHELLFGPLELRWAGDNQLPEASEHSTEETLACDIVCLPTSADFSLAWIAEATHLNIVDTGPWSQGMRSLAKSAGMTLMGPPRHPIERAHGSLSDVITGSVSGRMGEEITALLWTPA